MSAANDALIVSLAKDVARLERERDEARAERDGWEQSFRQWQGHALLLETRAEAAEAALFIHQRERDEMAKSREFWFQAHARAEVRAEAAEQALAQMRIAEEITHGQWKAAEQALATARDERVEEWLALRSSHAGLSRELATAREQIAELEAALEPFKEYINPLCTPLTPKHFEVARSALARTRRSDDA